MGSKGCGAEGPKCCGDFPGLGVVACMLWVVMISEQRAWVAAGYCNWRAFRAL